MKDSSHTRKACDGLTPLRRRILEILTQAAQPVKAYDLIAALRLPGRRDTTPATVYRSLEFLRDKGLAHRVNALNAYVACSGNIHAEHLFILFICRACRKTTELDDPALCATLIHHLNHHGLPQTDSIEIQGLCPACAASGIK
jgi:Fur family zinc uptake transcriptional regulator